MWHTMQVVCLKIVWLLIIETTTTRGLSSSAAKNETPCSNNEYEEKNGSCKVCLPGYYGVNCSLRCPPNYYGQNCEKKCEGCRWCSAETGCLRSNIAANDKEHKEHQIWDKDNQNGRKMTVKHTHIGQNVYLHCPISKTTAVTSISWYFYSTPSSASTKTLHLHGSLLETSYIVQVKYGYVKYEGGTVNNPSLYISRFGDNDEGYYMCVASNSEEIVETQGPILLRVVGNIKGEEAKCESSVHFVIGIVALSIILAVVIVAALASVMLQRNLLSRKWMHFPNWIRKPRPRLSVMSRQSTSSNHYLSINVSELAPPTVEPSGNAHAKFTKRKGAKFVNGNEAIKANQSEQTENLPGTSVSQNADLQMLSRSTKQKLNARWLRKSLSMSLSNSSYEKPIDTLRRHNPTGTVDLSQLYSVVRKQQYSASNCNNNESIEALYTLPCKKTQNANVTSDESDYGIPPLPTSIQGFDCKMKNAATGCTFRTIASSYIPVKPNDYICTDNLTEKSSSTESLVLASEKEVAELKKDKVQTSAKLMVQTEDDEERRTKRNARTTKTEEQHEERKVGTGTSKKKAGKPAIMMRLTTKLARKRSKGHKSSEEREVVSKVEEEKTEENGTVESAKSGISTINLRKVKRNVSGLQATTGNINDAVDMLSEKEESDKQGADESDTKIVSVGVNGQESLSAREAEIPSPDKDISSGTAEASETSPVYEDHLQLSNDNPASPTPTYESLHFKR